MNDWNAQYRRWEGESVGVWTRRLSIARYGLRLCLSGKVIKAFLAFGLIQVFAMSVVFFVFGQLAATDSTLINWINANSGRQLTQIINGLTSYALLYPEICVDGIYRAMFFLMKFTAPWLSLLTVALFVHKLIANDLASQAIVIYNSKALTRWDYLIGKFAIVATILSGIWILPVVFSWILGNLLSPDWMFFVYSFPSLLKGLLVGGVAVVSLSCIALAVSSMAKKTGTAVAYWILGWVTVNFVSLILSWRNPSLGYINPLKCIGAFSSGVYDMRAFLNEASQMLPFFGGFISNFEPNGVDAIPVSSGAVFLPFVVLGVMSVVSIFIVSRKVSNS